MSRPSSVGRACRDPLCGWVLVVAVCSAEWAAPRPARAQLVLLLLSCCSPWQGTRALYAHHTRTGCSPLRSSVTSLPAHPLVEPVENPPASLIEPVETPPQHVGRACRHPSPAPLAEPADTPPQHRWSSLSRPLQHGGSDQLSPGDRDSVIPGSDPGSRSRRTATVRVQNLSRPTETPCEDPKIGPDVQRRARPAAQP